MTQGIMATGALMIVGGIIFAFYVMNEMPRIEHMQGLLLGGMVSSVGIVVIALGRINESVMDLTKYFESKTEKKVIRNEDGYEKLD
jgi:hypothetical protein